MKATYTKPKICPKDKDIKKIWFVYFRYTNPITGERKLFKIKAGLNYISDKKERLKASEALKKVIDNKLKDGWNPIIDKTEKESHRKILTECLNEILNTKHSVLKKKSYHKYDKVLKMFTGWMEKNNLKYLYPQNFTGAMARLYLDFILTEKKYSGKSHNNQLSIIKSLFNALVTRDIISKNPFVGITELPEDKGKNFPFTDNEKEKLRNYLQVNCPHFFAACCFTYFCFIRRTELIELKVDDIDLINMTIRIHSEGSKNRQQQMVTIPKAMELILKEMELNQYPPHYYVFGRNFKICERKTIKPDYLSYKFRKIADGLGIDKSKGFYAWKHTGACALYNATKDIYLVSSQMRHSDIRITMIYLRSLGLTVNEKIREANFNF